MNIFKDRNSDLIINSPNDITNDLIRSILNNSMNSLTINYEFTRRPIFEHESSDEWENKQKLVNPFKIANEVRPIRRIEFEVKFGPAVQSLAYAFNGVEELEYVNINDTSNVTDMHCMFENAKSFNQPLGNWNTSRVTDMSCMFYGAQSFNQPIGKWNTSRVIDMSCMFCGAQSFNQPIGKWDTSNVRDMSAMFAEAISFNQPIGNWITSNVEFMESMFENARSFNQPIGKWDTSKVRSMQRMFLGAICYSYAKPMGAK